MPKKKDRKFKSATKAMFKAEHAARGAGASNATEYVDGDDDDAASIGTHLSLDDNESIAGDSLLGDPADLSEDAVRILEDRIKEAIDNSCHRNTRVRAVSLQSLNIALRKYYLPEFLMDWKVTIVDALERAVKKTDPDSHRTAVQIAAVLAVQLGMEVSDDLAHLIATLRPIASDPSQGIAFRADCCIAIGVFCMICEEEVETMMECKRVLRSIWAGFKTNCATECGTLFSASLYMWSLILLHPKLPPSVIADVFKADFPKLCTCLDSPHLEFRISTGETIALLYELGYDVLSGFRVPNHGDLLNRFLDLTADSAKYHAKRDRRMQRATFRDIYSAIKDGTSPDLSVKFGQEKLPLDTWWQKLSYDTLCRVLGAGINLHLKENLLVRDCFNLGPPLVESQMRKMTKLERQSINASICKARTQLRSKQRGCKQRLGSFSAA